MNPSPHLRSSEVHEQIAERHAQVEHLQTPFGPSSPPLWVAGKWAKVEIAQKNAWKILSFVENALKIRRFLDDFRLEKDDFRLSIEGKHGVFFRNLIFRYPLVTQHHYGKIHHVLPGESITNGHVLS